MDEGFCRLQYMSMLVASCCFHIISTCTADAATVYKVASNPYFIGLPSLYGA